MQDTVIKGTGNSRKFRLPPNALTIFPDWPSFVAYCTADGAPCDLSGPVPEGCEVVGTMLNKANLLTDLSAGLFGLTSTAVINDMWEKIKENLDNIIPNMSEAGFCRMLTGTASTGGGSIKLTATSSPYLAILVGEANNQSYLFVATRKSKAAAFATNPAGFTTVSVSVSGNSMTLSGYPLTTNIGTLYYVLFST